MILILGGTTEARLLLEKVIVLQEPVLISTAYTFAETFIEKHPLAQHITGKLSATELEALIKDKNITTVIDATHPYALAVSDNARHACEATGIQYIQLERRASNPINYEKAHFVESFEEAAALACELGDPIFLATGSNNAGIFRKEAEAKSRKAYIRVLPDETPIQKCLEAGFTHDEIITGVGPFTTGANRDLWHRLGITTVVTKDSGQTGGFPEKLHAAQSLNIDIVIIQRPPTDTAALKSIDEVLNTLNISHGRIKQN